MTEPEFRRGRRLGVDVGRARVGVATSDPDGLLATPLETVRRQEGDPIARILELADEYAVLEIVVGLPINLRGEETPSTQDAREVAGTLAARTTRPVRLVDERLSTVSAHSAMRESGRSQRSSRKIIDQAAAVILLQHALDVEKRTGRPSGETVTADPEPPRDV